MEMNGTENDTWLRKQANIVEIVNFQFEWGFNKRIKACLDTIVVGNA